MLGSRIRILFLLSLSTLRTCVIHVSSLLFDCNFDLISKNGLFSVSEDCEIVSLQSAVLVVQLKIYYF
jgi:hypothetical protein